jgi:hypothetical protein
MRACVRERLFPQAQQVSATEKVLERLRNEVLQFYCDGYHSLSLSLFERWFDFA